MLSLWISFSSWVTQNLNRIWTLFVAGFVVCPRYLPSLVLFFQELLALQKGTQWVHLLAGALEGLVSVVGEGHLIEAV